MIAYGKGIVRARVTLKPLPIPLSTIFSNTTIPLSYSYEYDDHYFLTDPREFIYEFYPLQEEWQLLKRPITLREFENLPFVRSLFFRYGLHFADEGYGAVVFTDDTGAATVRIAMPTDMQSCLIFHYNLKFYDSDEELSYDGVSLKRFVMQSVIGNIVAFRVHAPCSGAFLLDIFANAVTPQEYLTGEPMKFKSVCKFKVSIGSFPYLYWSLNLRLRIRLSDLLRGAADGNGAAAGLRQRRMGTHQGDAPLWPDTHNTSGE